MKRLESAPKVFIDVRKQSVLANNLCRKAFLFQAEKDVFGGIPDITDDGLVFLEAFEDLRQVNLDGCTYVTDQGALYLARITQLESLTLKGCARISTSGVSLFHTLENLQRLDLTGCIGVRDSCMKRLAQLDKRLTDLTLNKCEALTDTGLLELAPIKGLMSLSVCELPRITVKGLGVLAYFPRLMALSARSLPLVNDGIFPLLAACPNLRTMAFTHNKLIKGAGMDLLPDACHSLRGMDLTDSPNLASVAVQGLVNMKRLHTLLLHSCPLIDDLALESIATCMRLKHLSLSNCHLITSLGVSNLASLPMLKTLDVSYTDVLDEGVQSFGGSRSLVHVNLDGCTLLKGAFAPALLKVPTLEGLSCTYCTGMSAQTLKRIGTKAVPAPHYIVQSATEFWLKLNSPDPAESDYEVCANVDDLF